MAERHKKNSRIHTKSITKIGIYSIALLYPVPTLDRFGGPLAV